MKLKKLAPEQRRILKERGTEPPFTGKYLYNKEKGVYMCASCGSELFSSDKKFDSGSGWPSFFAAAAGVSLRADNSHGMKRTEVYCKKCGSHMGHVFDDGPETVIHADGTSVRTTKKRYCINSLALSFRKK